jgi:hypothetical protein
MNKIILLVVIACSISIQGFSQDRHAPLSYDAVMKEQAGFTSFEIRYGRPTQRGRDIFGAFIPYEKRWRAGANGTTTIAFNTQVTLENTLVEAGKYALLVVPGTEHWDIILHRDTMMFSRPTDYLTSEEVAHVTVKAEKTARHQEAFTISTDIVNDDLVVQILWDFTGVSFTLKTGALQQSLKALRTKIRNNEFAQADDFANAASFIAYNLSAIGIQAKDTAVTLINKAITIEPAAWHYRVKRNIYWFARDINGIEKASKEWIAFNTSFKIENYNKENERIEEERAWYKKTIKLKK